MVGVLVWLEVLTGDEVNQVSQAGGFPAVRQISISIAFRDRFDRLVGMIEAEAEDALAATLTYSREERRRMYR